MDQIKVVLDNLIKRSYLPPTHDSFITIIKKLYDIPQKFSISYIDNKGQTSYITNNTYEDFKSNVKNSPATIKVLIRPPIENDDNADNNYKSETLTESVFSFIQYNLDNGYKNLKKLYIESKMPEMYESVVNETSNILYSIQDRIFDTFCFNNKNNKENHYHEKYFKQLNIIKYKLKIKKTDQIILDYLEKNHGDIKKTVTDLLQ